MEKYDSVVYLLHAVNHMMWIAKEEVLGKVGLNFPQAMLLGFLKENEGRDVNQKTIGEKLRVKGSSVTSIIGTMQKNGLITKRVNPNDGREFFVTLTEKGNDVADGIADMIDSIDEKAADALSEEEKAVMVELLKKMLAQSERCEKVKNSPHKKENKNE